MTSLSTFSKKHIFFAVVLIIGLFFAILPQNSFASGGGKKDTQTNLLALKTFIVNLSVPGRYLKADIELELDDPKKLEEITKEIPRLRDAIIRLIAKKTAEELLTSEGKDNLTDEILNVSNITLGRSGRPPVVGVYFTEFVIQ